MFLNIRDLSAKGITAELAGKLDLKEMIQGRPEIVRAEPLDVKLQARAAGGVADVTGELSAKLELVCSRCLERFEEELRIPFHEVFSQKQETSPTDDEDEDIHVVHDDKVDLKPYLEENVVLALPFVPVCKEHCKGLCPVCGKNRNEQDCGCKDERIDPRLAGLQGFFKDQE